jgi:hypothetical protein
MDLQYVKINGHFFSKPLLILVSITKKQLIILIRKITYFPWSVLWFKKTCFHAFFASNSSIRLWICYLVEFLFSLEEPWRLAADGASSGWLCTFADQEIVHGEFWMVNWILPDSERLASNIIFQSEVIYYPGWMNRHLSPIHHSPFTIEKFTIRIPNQTPKEFNASGRSSPSGLDIGADSCSVHAMHGYSSLIPAGICAASDHQIREQAPGCGKTVYARNSESVAAIMWLRLRSATGSVAYIRWTANCAWWVVNGELDFARFRTPGFNYNLSISGHFFPGWMNR